MSPAELLTNPAVAATATSTFIWKKLATMTTGKPAPMPDGKNIWIEIDIELNHAIAVFHCQDEEHVHAHKARSVTFRADQDCLLVFTNWDVFECEVVQLFAHKEKVLPVKDDLGKRTKKVETFYDVYTMTPATVPVAKAFQPVATQAALRPPVIVVP